VSVFHDRVVIVTGAAGGLGKAMSSQLSALGARLALVDRNADAVNELAAKLGDRHMPIVQDLAEVGALRRLVSDVSDNLGPIHTLINNAGVTVHGPFTGQGAQDIDHVLDIDLRSVMHLTHAALPGLLQTEGNLVFVSSMAGLHGFPMQSTYSAAKFGMRGFAQSLRAELAPKGVSVTTVMPGTVATPFLANAYSLDPTTSATIASLMQRYGASSDYVARRIIDAIVDKRSEVRIGWDCIALGLIDAVAPSVVPASLRAAMHLYWRRKT